MPGGRREITLALQAECAAGRVRSASPGARSSARQAPDLHRPAPRGRRGVGAGDRGARARRRRRDPAALQRSLGSEMLAYELEIAHQARAEAGRPAADPARPARYEGPLPPPLAAILDPLSIRLVGGAGGVTRPDRASFMRAIAGQEPQPLPRRRHAVPGLAGGDAGGRRAARTRRSTWCGARRGVPRRHRAPRQHRAGEGRAPDGQDLPPGARAAAGARQAGARGADRLPEAERRSTWSRADALFRAGASASPTSSTWTSSPRMSGRPAWPERELRALPAPRGAGQSPTPARLGDWTRWTASSPAPSAARCSASSAPGTTSAR